MAEIYARDTKLYREVAIKILPEAFTTDPDRVAVVPAPSRRRSGGGALARVHVEWSFVTGFHEACFCQVAAVYFSSSCSMQTSIKPPERAVH
jgi:hypothetical protein